MPYETPEQAYAIAQSMGCRGIHRAADGSYMPCSTDAEYRRMKKTEKAKWSAAFRNRLPDSSFLYISPGGKKDAEGKISPRSLRHLPYRDASGKVDMPHLRNAIARIPQTDLPASVKTRLMRRARDILARENKVEKADPLALENALRRKMRSHNKKYGTEKSRRASLAALKSQYTQGMSAYSNGNKVQTKEQFAMGHVNAYLKKLSGAMATSKFFDVFKLDKFLDDKYPVCSNGKTVSGWSDLVFMLKSVCNDSSASCDFLVGEDVVAEFSTTDHPVLGVASATPHSLLDGVFEYEFFSPHRGDDGVIGKSAWMKKQFDEGDIVECDHAEVEYGSVTGLPRLMVAEATKCDFKGSDALDTFSEIMNTGLFLDGITKNKLSDNATMVFISAMPTEDEMLDGAAYRGSIKKNLEDQIVNHLDVLDGDITFVNMVPYECLDADGKRISPPAEEVEKWAMVVKSAVESAASGAIVIALGKEVSDHYDDLIHFTLPHPFSKSKFSLPRKVDEIKKAYDKSFDRQVKITKSDEERQLVYGVVLEPEVIDAHYDVVSVDEIESAAHNYLIKSRMVGDQHNKPAKADIVESYIAPTDLNIGGQHVRKGSWVMVTRIHDQEMWHGIKKGAYTGYSIGGYAVKEPIDES